LGILSTITDQPGLHRRNWTCGAGANFDASFLTGFATGFAIRRETDFRALAARRVKRRDVRVAVIGVTSITRRAGFIFYLSKFSAALP
jgi:hypothetical protein